MSYELVILILELQDRLGVPMEFLSKPCALMTFGELHGELTKFRDSEACPPGAYICNLNDVEVWYQLCEIVQEIYGPVKIVISSNMKVGEILYGE